MRIVTAFALIGSAFAGLVATAPSFAQSGVAPSSIAQSDFAQSGARSEQAPVLVEMFLSQSCKLSPPAAAYLTELKAQSDLVVLSWHVDYWDLLSNRKDGRWKDRFAIPEAAERQRVYNRDVRNRSTVFTPQAIVNGSASAVGSKQRDVQALIDAARSPRPDRRMIEFRREGERFAVIARSEDRERDVFLAVFRERASTPITGGDNAGVDFDEPHVVAQFIRLGTAGAKSSTFRVSEPPQGMGCAVLLQSKDHGEVAAARYCPDTN